MSNILKSKLVVLACTVAAASSAWAGGKLAIPLGANVDVGYFSTQLLLKPCLNDHALRKMSEDPAVLKDSATARKALRPGTCGDHALVEKLFKARFLQYATLDVVIDPWNVDKTIAAQNKAIGQCKNTHCLDRALDTVIGALAPVYLHARPG
ncbi:hypothetical protein [Burkholderia vietnamiensis]|uniref:hypothetical protein n=1 Tax=Burkholderia vietnamiensis TaxID=60552 RepID=UPI0018C51624|nr:hypothetical protein [Burkholderia vietnamiensis]